MFCLFCGTGFRITSRLLLRRTLQLPVTTIGFQGCKVNSAMAYCKFQADQLFTGYELLNSNHVLITDTKGKVLDITTIPEAGDGVQQLRGILSPGFINCHCHLELSHMRGNIPENTGLTQFISSVMKYPSADQSVKDEQMRLADEEMYANGTVAVGDISNQAYSLTQKIKSKLHWYNFLEITNLDDEKAEDRMKYFHTIKKEFTSKMPLCPATISPHAIYSVSPKTFRLMNADTKNKTITIHNQECAAENELFRKGSGKFLQFYKTIGRTTLPIPVSGKSSLQTWLPYFNNEQTIISVHNTFILEEDIEFARAYTTAHNMQIIYCLCPNANIYIENRLPPVDLLIKHQCKMVLGTDSYGSNRQLSIAKEIETLQHNLPHIPVKNILQWATINGANALGFEKDLGSFEKGKQPGIVLITDDHSRSERIL